MRALGWSLMTVLFAGPAVFGQQPPAASPLNIPANDPLPVLLQQWEQQMKAIKAIEATVTRTETDNVVNTTSVYEGTARLLRPDRADLYLKKKGNPQVYERFVLTGNYLYEFVQAEKKLRVHQLPQRAPGQPVLDDNFLGLLFGLTAQQAMQRYELQVVPKPEDKNYYYLVVTPKLAADKAEFIKARLVLWQNSFLPRQIEFVGRSGPIVWDILRIVPNAPLRPTDFQKPALPAGWQMKIEPPPGSPPPGSPGALPPTTVRPSGRG